VASKLSIIDKIKSSLFFDIFGIMNRNKSIVLFCFVLMWCLYLVVYVANIAYASFSNYFLITIIIFLILLGEFILYLFVKKKVIFYVTKILKINIKGKFVVFSLIHVVLYVLFIVIMLIVGIIVKYSVKTQYLPIVMKVIAIILFFKFFIVLSVISVRYLLIGGVKNSVRISFYDVLRNKLSFLKLFFYEVILFGLFFFFYYVMTWVVILIVKLFSITNIVLVQKIFITVMTIIFFLYLPILVLFVYFYLFKILVKK
jgi:hypothetical protein